MERRIIWGITPPKMIKFLYINNLLAFEMNVYKRVREHKQHTQEFPEIDQFVGSKSGILFKDFGNMNSFTNADDMFFEDNSV